METPGPGDGTKCFERAFMGSGTSGTERMIAVYESTMGTLFFNLLQLSQHLGFSTAGHEKWSLGLFVIES
eukprot:1325353-Amorphochlora_amoeboformis.AAC.2